MKNPEARTMATDFRLTAYTDALIWLPDLIRTSLRAGESVVRGRTFTNCLIQGPAVFLAIRGVELDACNLGYSGGDIRNLILRPASPTSVVGAIPFEACTFRFCDFDRIGFTGSEPFLNSILAIPIGEPQGTA